jgi:Asp-tRNA(Asn)/Glu-tRNA(Gln) amidotransferase A subunit family amidase
MPVAVQLVGAEGNELGLIDLARRLEKHLGGFIRHRFFEQEDLKCGSSCCST